jgi:hypothetical protein
MKKICFLLLGLMHLTVIVYNNVIAEEQALSRYFYDKQEPGGALRLLAKHPRCLQLFDCYSKYTGAETGYGLYAPNVSSDIVILLTSMDGQGRILSVESPQLHTCEARIRLSSAAGIFMEKTGKVDKDRSQYLGLVLKSMAMWAQEQKPGCKKVFADLLVYDLPAAKEIRNERHPSYIKLGHYEYTF